MKICLQSGSNSREFSSGGQSLHDPGSLLLVTARFSGDNQTATVGFQEKNALGYGQNRTIAEVPISRESPTASHTYCGITASATISE
jgi:hypothetical protein